MLQFVCFRLVKGGEGKEKVRKGMKGRERVREGVRERKSEEKNDEGGGKKE